MKRIMSQLLPFMKHAIIVLALCTASLAQAPGPDKSAEFLGIKLGVSLSAQLPSCGIEPQPPKCYAGTYPHFTVSWDGGEGQPAYVHTIDEINDSVGMVLYRDPGEGEQVLASMKAKRGKPTTCKQGIMKNKFGAKFTALSCTWHMPWGELGVEWTETDQPIVWASTNVFEKIDEARRPEALRKKPAY